jgi:hypothetical protein
VLNADASPPSLWRFIWTNLICTTAYVGTPVVAYSKLFSTTRWNGRRRRKIPPRWVNFLCVWLRQYADIFIESYDFNVENAHST